MNPEKKDYRRLETPSKELYNNFYGKKYEETYAGVKYLEYKKFMNAEVDESEYEKARVKVSIDLTTLSVEKDPNHNNKINLFGDVGVVMKYPTMDVMKRLENLDTDDLDKVFSVVADSIDYIYQGEEIFYGKEQKHEELLQFLNNLTSEQFVKVQQFFATMPRIKKEIEYTCPVCQKHHRKMLEGMQSFF